MRETWIKGRIKSDLITNTQKIRRKITVHRFDYRPGKVDQF